MNAGTFIISMMPAEGSDGLGLAALPVFLAVRSIHVLSLSCFHSEIVTRFFLTRNELFSGTISFSRLDLTSLYSDNTT